MSQSTAGKDPRADPRADEEASISAELDPGHEVVRPGRQRAPFVFCSPHSGRVYPSVLLEASRLDAHALRRSEDCYVDELFAGVAALGAPLIAARFARAYLDVNREPYELDPELFGEELPADANTRSMRVAGGLGTIARIVSDAEAIYDGPLPLAAGLARIERLYQPFHDALAALLADTRARFGTAILIDCHSMPSSIIGRPSAGRPDFVLGDRFGEACDSKLTRYLRDVLTGLGYHVQINRPYAGGFITEHYGKPGHGTHALQVEINRALYMNERTLQRFNSFQGLRQDLMVVAAKMFEDLPGLLAPRAAAE